MSLDIIGSIPKQGDVGRDVVAIQIALVQNGQDVGVVDGIFGAKTMLAVQALQKQFNLGGSGIIGPKTLAILGLEVSVISPVTELRAITRPLAKRKSSRHLHPTLRLLLESKLFVGGEVPKCFKERDLPACVKAVAKAFIALGVKEEGGNNRGTKVGYIQSIIGNYVENGVGDAWCMSVVQCNIAFLEDYFQLESPVEDSEHCMTVFNMAQRVPGLSYAGVSEGAAFIFREVVGGVPRPNGHTGIIMALNPSSKMDTIEGNTGSGSLSDGDGLYAKKRDPKKNGTFETMGCVYFWPYNGLPR